MTELKVGAVVIPVMPAQELIELVVGAEEVGLDYCLVADEGFMPDVYVTLGAVASRTSRIRIGPMTNGYTRHPAVTAAAVATLNELSEGRALATLVAGGSAVLDPMGIERIAPVGVVDESMEIMRRLWTGEPVTWEGGRHRLTSAQLSTGPHHIPIWTAGRGRRMLTAAGRRSDGVILEVKADLPAAIELVDEGARASGNQPRRIYLDRLAYRPEMVNEAASSVFVQVLVDSPDRQLRALGLEQSEIGRLRETYESSGPAAAARLITPEIVREHQIVGTPDECSTILGDLTRAHDLDVFLCYVKKPGLEENIAMLADIRAIVTDASRTARRSGPRADPASGTR